MIASPVVPAADAATVILARHAPRVGSPWECFMVRRPVRSDFAADVFVFPGGKVDPGDRDPALAAHVTSHRGPEEGTEDAAAWRSLQVAAIRELFEEAGVLLAYGREGAPLRLEGDDVPRFAEHRRRLQSGEMSTLDLAAQEGLRFAADRLHPFSRWITPEGLPRRYDTRFFVAFMPEHQEPVADPVETTDGVWIAPRQALERNQRGDFPLVLATHKHLERMAGFHSIEQMVAATRAADLQPVMPRMVERGGRVEFVLRGQPGYH